MSVAVTEKHPRQGEQLPIDVGAGITACLITAGAASDAKTLYGAVTAPQAAGIIIAMTVNVRVVVPACSEASAYTTY